MPKREEVSMRSDFLNFLRFSVTETAANTFTELELDTNLSAERGVMMEIHSIEIDWKNLTHFREVAAGGTEDIRVQVTRESKTSTLYLNDSDVIAVLAKEITRSAAIGTDAGPLYVAQDKVVKIDFAKPIPYVKPSIFVGLLATSAAATNVYGRIGYTLRDISREAFLELLVALQ